VNLDRRKENVADEATVDRSDEGDRARDTAQRVDERGFIRPPERVLMHDANVVRVARFLGSDADRRTHPRPLLGVASGLRDLQASQRAPAPVRRMI
jgi:hypothetical protein